MRFWQHARAVHEPAHAHAHLPFCKTPFLPTHGCFLISNPQDAPTRGGTTDHYRIASLVLIYRQVGVGVCSTCALCRATALAPTCTCGHTIVIQQNSGETRGKELPRSTWLALAAALPFRAFKSQERIAGITEPFLPRGNCNGNCQLPSNSF